MNDRTIERLAEDARLSLSDSEKQALASHLERMEQFLCKLRTAPALQDGDSFAVSLCDLRPDVTAEKEPRTAMTANTAHVCDGYFSLVALMEEDA